MPRYNAPANLNWRVHHPQVRPAPLVSAVDMFARAVSAPRLIVAVLAALAVLSGCGGQRQDADEPEGTFKVDIADASFPQKQSIAEQSTMRIRVHNAAKATVPNVAVTVQTKGARPGDGRLGGSREHTLKMGRHILRLGVLVEPVVA